MLKKIVLNIFVFISIFFVIDKVSAFELIGPSWTPSLGPSSSSSIAENFNLNITSVPTNLTYGAASYNYIMNTFLPNELYKEYGEYYVCIGSPTAYGAMCFISNNIDSFVISSSGDGKYIYLYYDPISETDIYKYSITSGKKSSSSAYLTSRITSLNVFVTGDYLKTNLPYFKMSDPNYATIVTSDGYYFNNDDIFLYLDGDSYVVNTEYKTSLKDYYEVSLSNITYSAIEVQFSIDDFTMVDEGNDINLDYEIYLNNDMILPLLPIPQEEVYRTLAPSEYSLGTTVNLMFDEKTNNYSYEGVKHYDYWNTVTYRFEFPFTSDYIGNITFKFWSDSSYTITLEERDNEENDINYIELDLTGKYGVGFIPKVTSFDTLNEFYGIFKVPYQNSYRLMFYKDYQYINQNNNNNLLVDSTLLSLENFEYKFTKDNSNSYLLFINNNFESGNDASVLYNSNYFNYCILDESISTCDIVNPNTEESIVIEPNLSDKDSFGLKNIFNSFLSFSNSTNFILDNVTNFYNNFLPSELQSFFFISFGFVVIIMITKIVL